MLLKMGKIWTYSSQLVKDASGGTFWRSPGGPGQGYKKRIRNKVQGWERSREPTTVFKDVIISLGGKWEEKLNDMVKQGCYTQVCLEQPGTSRA